MKLKLHDESAQHRNNKDKVFVVRFNDGLKAAIVDKYCTVPDSNCVTIRLEFNEVNESGSFLGKRFSLSLDTETWKVSELQCENVNVDCEGLLKEFVAGLDASLKETFRTRVKLAKEYGNDEVMDWLDDVNVEDGLCFSYTQVYGERDSQAFIFEYKDRKYLVDNQYCSNPKCKCNEAVLSFINIIPDRDKLISWSGVASKQRGFGGLCQRLGRYGIGFGAGAHFGGRNPPRVKLIFTSTYQSAVPVEMTGVLRQLRERQTVPGSTRGS